MKRVNKKILFILIMSLVCMTALTMMHTYAVDEDIEEEITYENIPDDKAAIILKELYGIELDVPMLPINLLCVLTNHIKDYGSVTQYEHNYFADNPHCRVTTTYVEYCTRSGCDYFAINDRYTGRTSCH